MHKTWQTNKQTAAPERNTHNTTHDNEKSLFQRGNMPLQECFALVLHIMLKPQSEFSVSETQTDTGLCLYPHSHVRLVHHICAVGWREVYLIFMALRPLRAGVTTVEWSMRGLERAKTSTLFRDIREQIRQMWQWDAFVSNDIDYNLRLRLYQNVTSGFVSYLLFFQHWQTFQQEWNKWLYGRFKLNLSIGCCKVCSILR